MKTCNHPTCEGPCRRVKKVKPRKRIRPASKKREKQLRKYSKKKKEEFQEGDVCAVSMMEKTDQVKEIFKECQYFACDYHHPGGKIEDELLTEEVVKLCRSCHRVVEDNPKLAKELGLSKSRITKT